MESMHLRVIRRHVTLPNIPGFTPPERDKAWEQGYRRTLFCVCAAVDTVPGLYYDV